MQKAPKRRRGRLSRRAIAFAALDLIDTVGLETFSMERLARALRVEAMSIYHYFSNRSELLDEVARMVVSEMSAVLPRCTGDLERDLRRLAQSYRRSVLHHPRAFSLVVVRSVSRLGRHALLEAGTQLLLQAGCDSENSRRIIMLLAPFLNGMLQLEIAEVMGHAHSESASSEDGVEDDGTPSLFKLQPGFQGWDDEISIALQYGLDAILHGLRAKGAFTTPLTS